MEEELLIIEAIYGADLVWKQKGERTIFTLPLSTASASAAYCPISIVFMCENDAVSEISLDCSSDQLSVLDLKMVQELEQNVLRAAREEVDKNQGKECIYNAMLAASDAWAVLQNDNFSLITSKDDNHIGNEAIRPEVYERILYLDHMRDKKSYYKTLDAWCRQYDINGFLLMKKELQHKEPLAKEVYLLLFGEKDSLDTFGQHLRTENVDVNSKGQPCKERMSRDLLYRKIERECIEEWKAGLEIVVYGEKVQNILEIVEKKFPHHVCLVKDFASFLS